MRETKEQMILRLLEDGELSGLDLVQRSLGRLKRGVVYITLARMEEKGLIEARQEPGRFAMMPRRLYKLPPSTPK